MNRTTMIIIAAGFAFALFAAVVVQMIGGKKESDIDNTKTTAILIASKDLKAGDKLLPGTAEWMPWPESVQFAGAIRRDGHQKPEEALKGRVKRSVTKGEPLTTSVVIEDTKASFVAASLTKGKRAVTVNVTAQSSVAGFLNPGDYVDIILTYDVKLPSDEKVRKSAQTVVTKLASEIVLENLKVLAFDQDTKKTEAKVGKTVTLEASPREAEVLTLASKMGTLSLALRSLGDDTPAHNTTDGKPFTTTTDIRVSGVMREIMKGENNAGSVSQVVRVYSGSRVDNIEVRPYTTR
ncbi:MAG: Flp pilus assembly protein CpaB [Proteobacteria bacterium]|nr:Flp pilus assembly protein CpaB [Pseudomonadota bacterium]